MPNVRQRPVVFALLAFIGGAFLGLILIREPMESLTSEGVARAKEVWRAKGPKDYFVRYLMHQDEYCVTVEDGIVTDVSVNGQKPRTENLRSYSIDGLFDLLELELTNLSDPNGPFGSAGDSIIARVRFNKEYGYVERYLRSAGGMGRGAAIEVLEFEPGRQTNE